MDVEVILKRLLVYTAVLAAIAAIYVVILRTSGGSFIQSEDRTIAGSSRFWRRSS